MKSSGAVFPGDFIPGCLKSSGAPAYRPIGIGWPLRPEGGSTNHLHPTGGMAAVRVHLFRSAQRPRAGLSGEWGEPTGPGPGASSFGRVQGHRFRFLLPSGRRVLPDGLSRKSEDAESSSGVRCWPVGGKKRGGRLKTPAPFFIHTMSWVKLLGLPAIVRHDNNTAGCAGVALSVLDLTAD